MGMLWRFCSFLLLVVGEEDGCEADEECGCEGIDEYLPEDVKNCLKVVVSV